MEWEQIVGGNVKRLRKERGMTQEQLALEADVTLRYIGMIERAETSASVGMLGRLAKALQVNPSEFFQAFGSPDH